ncbi:MAG: hypothetical protein ACJAX5_000099 [Patiriisocius sp.]|jgi:hypothetical protein
MTTELVDLLNAFTTNKHPGHVGVTLTVCETERIEIICGNGACSSRHRLPLGSSGLYPGRRALRCTQMILTK